MVQELTKALLTLVKTHHPLVLHYYGICVVSNVELWVVMEHANGNNLNHALKSKVISFSALC